MIDRSLRTLLITAILLCTTIQATPAQQSYQISEDPQPKLVAKMPSPTPTPAVIRQIRGNIPPGFFGATGPCVQPITPQDIAFQIGTVDPTNPLPDQPVVVAFTLINNSKGKITGRIGGMIRGTNVQLENLPNDYAAQQHYDTSASDPDPAHIRQSNDFSFVLAPGGKVKGALGWHAALTSQHNLDLLVDQDTCLHPTGEWDTSNPNKPAPKLSTFARLANATYAFNVREGIVLTSTDRIPNLPQPSEDACGPIGKHHFGISLFGKDLVSFDLNGHSFPAAANQWAEVKPNAIVPVVGTVKPAAEEHQPGAHEAGMDLPFNHPFGQDWVWYLFPDPDWANLLNVKRDFLESESEKRLLPANYRPREGDRVLQYGEWAVDCGHDFHTETHPPAFIAVGRTSTLNPGNVESTMITIPYRTREIYGPDNNSLLEHAFIELGKVVTLTSSSLETIPVVDKRPFNGKIVAKYQVKLVRGRPGGYGLVPQLGYHFSPPRPGVQVQVSAGPVSADVTVTMDTTAPGYQQAPDLLMKDGDSPLDLPNDFSKAPVSVPTCWKKQYKVEDIDTLIHEETGGWKSGDFQNAVNGITGALGGWAAGSILTGGLAPGALSPHDASAAGTAAIALKAALDKGFYQLECNVPQPPEPFQVKADPNQIYPVYGWVQIKWVKGPPLSSPLIPPGNPPAQ